MANLKVLMMGGRRCGKTSALASLFDQMTHGRTNEFLTVSDQTKPEEKDGEKKELLLKKRMELKNFISIGKNQTFLADQGPTSHYWTYILQLQIPGRPDRNMNIEFIDGNGEFFEAGGRHHNETVAFVRECDVFVVIVDTPYLMAGSDVEAESANIIDSIHTFLMQIDNQNGRKSKQVIFVLFICEKWVKEGKIDDVVKVVEEKYDATIKDLKASNKTEISIIPIETAGDIIFAKLMEPYILFNTSDNKQTRCAKVSDRMVMLPDGKHKKIADDEVLNDDPEGVFKFGEEVSDIVRPNAWFHLRNEPKAAYTPNNCEQLPLHIIRFMFNKKKHEAWGGVIGTLISFFGGISSEDMQDALDNLSQANLIKDSGEGIKILKKCF